MPSVAPAASMNFAANSCSVSGRALVPLLDSMRASSACPPTVVTRITAGSPAGKRASHHGSATQRTFAASARRAGSCTCASSKSSNHTPSPPPPSSAAATVYGPEKAAA
ncbi:Uncharacterised protein [Burkholderia pseudomallei]|nr:Uncharacterised protein [Burkholderia pseudomallei]